MNLEIYHTKGSKSNREKHYMISFTCVHAKLLQSCLTLATPWTVAHQVPVFMGFPRQEYWSWLPGPPPGDLPDPRSNLHLLCLLHWQVGSLSLAPPGKPMIYGTIWYINTIWYLLYVESKVWNKWTYLWNPDRLTDIKTKLWLPKGKEVGKALIRSLGLADVNYYILNG